MAKVFLNPERVTVGSEKIEAAGLGGVTVLEILRDPGKHARVWNVLKWILTGEKEYRDEAEKRLGDLADKIMR